MNPRTGKEYLNRACEGLDRNLEGLFGDDGFFNYDANFSWKFLEDLDNAIHQYSDRREELQQLGERVSGYLNGLGHTCLYKAKMEIGSRAAQAFLLSGSSKGLGDIRPFFYVDEIHDWGGNASRWTAKLLYLTTYKDLETERDVEIDSAIALLKDDIDRVHDSFNQSGLEKDYQKMRKVSEARRRYISDDTDLDLAIKKLARDGDKERLVEVANKILDIGLESYTRDCVSFVRTECYYGGERFDEKIVKGEDVRGRNARRHNVARYASSRVTRVLSYAERPDEFLKALEKWKKTASSRNQPDTLVKDVFGI